LTGEKSPSQKQDAGQATVIRVALMQQLNNDVQSMLIAVRLQVLDKSAVCIGTVAAVCTKQWEILCVVPGSSQDASWKDVLQLLQN
jgi:hypothetical protein